MIPLPVPPMLLHRRGEHLEARVAADEMLPLARRIGGSEYLGPALLGEAELELARGNEAAARQALLEAVDIAAEEDVAHVLPLIPAAARLLPKKDVEALLERVSALSPLPLNEAQRTEATARITGDADRFREAASLYAPVETPDEEAQCLAAAGDVDAAAAIFERLGVPVPAIVRSGFPSLAAGVPADEDVTGDEERDPLEKRTVGVAVDPQLTDLGASIGDRHACALRLFGVSRARAEHHLVVFEERDPGPGDLGILGQRVHDRPQNVVGLAAPFENPVEGFEGVRAHSSRSAPSKARIVALNDWGIGVGRWFGSTRTSVCEACTIRVSSGSR